MAVAITNQNIEMDNLVYGGVQLNPDPDQWIIGSLAPLLFLDNAVAMHIPLKMCNVPKMLDGIGYTLRGRYWLKLEKGLE